MQAGSTCVIEFHNDSLSFEVSEQWQVTEAGLFSGFTLSKELCIKMTCCSKDALSEVLTL